MRIVFGWVVAVAALSAFGAAVAIALGLLQTFHPAFDSFSHFRLHFVVILIVSAALLVIVRIGVMRWMALGVVLLGSGFLYLEAQDGPPTEDPERSLRLVQANLNFRNPAIDRAMQALVAQDADILTLQEITRAHKPVVLGIGAYPHQAHCVFSRGVGDIAILSRHPLSQVRCKDGLGLLTAVVDAPGGAVTVGSIHAHWPWPISQHAQIDEWVSRLRKIDGPVILAGDFNAAPWSDAVARVAETSRTKVVPGLRMTIGVRVLRWLPAIPIPIDHVLLSDAFCGLGARVGPKIGSDHLPVIVDIGRVETTRSSLREC